MIQINLVPVTEKKKKKEFIFTVYAAASVFLLLAIMFFLWNHQRAEFNKLNEQKRDIENQIAANRVKVDLVNQKKDLQSNLDSLNKTNGDISEINQKVLAAIDQLALNLPDGIWLTRITQGTGKDVGKFTIQGYAVSVAKMKSYISNLQKPGGLLGTVTFDEKNMNATVQGNNSGFKLHQFEISFIVNEIKGAGI